MDLLSLWNVNVVNHVVLSVELLVQGKLTFCQALANTICSPSDLYCTLEVDSFGFFSNKAKTRVYRYTSEPKWNEVTTETDTKSESKCSSDGE